MIKLSSFANAASASLGALSPDQKFDYLISCIEMVFIDQNVFESEIIFCKNIAIKLGFKKGVIDYFIENFGKKNRKEFREAALHDYMYPETIRKRPKIFVSGLISPLCPKTGKSVYRLVKNLIKTPKFAD